jgi:pimeloyl-ACP methyl ester carboxylesterase
VELKTVIGAGHEVNIESPQELAEILHAFYERMS